MAKAPFLDELLEQTADCAYIIDGEQRISAWNRAAENLLGFRAEDVIGQPCHQIIGGHTDEGCVVCRLRCQPFTASRRGELVPSFDAQVRTARGQQRWVNVSIIALAQDEADPVVVHMMRDIEAKKQAESFASDVATWVQQLQIGSSDANAEDVLPRQTLTKREHQVLTLLAKGASTESIANELVIGATTVRNHIQHILHKLGAHSRLEAVTHAREHHLLD